MPRLTFFAAVPVLLVAVLALSACATGTPTAPASSPSAKCEVTVVVDFGVLNKPALKKCAPAGAAAAALTSSGITTAGTDDY
ncbi:MAG: hypothetical protein V4479_06365, partial [Actinomycetota bacterium]